MGGSPQYQTPYPVTRRDGSQIIWSWDTRQWQPYDRAPAAPAAAAQPAADAAIPRTPPEAPGNTEGAAPAGAGGESGAGGFAQVPRRPVRRRVVTRSAAPLPGLPGSSLLDSSPERGRQ